MSSRKSCLQKERKRKRKRERERDIVNWKREREREGGIDNYTENPNHANLSN